MYENNKYINAAVLTKQRKKLSLLNLAPEKNLQKGQLLVKLYSTSIVYLKYGRQKLSYVEVSEAKLRSKSQISKFFFGK